MNKNQTDTMQLTRQVDQWFDKYFLRFPPLNPMNRQMEQAKAELYEIVGITQTEDPAPEPAPAP